MLYLLLLIGVAVALVEVWALKRRERELGERVADLERMVSRLTGPGPVADEETRGAEQPRDAPETAELPGLLEPAEPEAPSGPVPLEPADDGPMPPGEGPRRLGRLAGSLRERWLVWVAAASLALGAVFLVQYGVETGILGPAARVAGAALLGVALIAASERLRLMAAGGQQAALTPSAALAAGGVSALFTAAFAAHFLYGLTGPNMGFATMALASGAAILYGLRQGPVLSAIGVLGAYATPLLIESDRGTPLLYAYILSVALAALLIERHGRWIWLSAAATAVAFLWGGLIFVITGPDHWLALFTLAVVAAAVCIPEFGLPPRSEEHAMTGEMLAARQPFYYPTVLATAAMAAGAAVLALSGPASVAAGQAALLAGAALAAVAAFGLRRAENLDDGAIVAALGFLGVLGLAGLALYPALPPDPDLGYPGTSGSLRLLGWAATATLGAAAAVFAAGLMRAATGNRPALWSAVAAAYPALALIVFYLVWGERTGWSDAAWGAVAALTAVPATLAAGRFRRSTREMSLPVGLLALGAIGSIGLAAGFALTGAPLTIAFAVIALAGVLLDRRFDMGVVLAAAQAGAVLATARLLIMPGLGFALTTDLATLWLSFAPPIALLAAGAHAARARARRRTRAVLESAAATLLAVFVSVLTVRWLDGSEHTLVLAGLLALTWGAAALAQGWRARTGGRLAPLRRGLGWTYSGVAALALTLGLTIGNPLLGGAPYVGGGRVLGPPLLDSMMIGYLLPGLLLMAAPVVLGLPAGWRRTAARTGGALLAALWLGLEIRRAWRGDDLSVPGVTNSELYSYTVAMLVATLAAIALGHVFRRPALRTAGLALAAATAVKVFALDMAGLVGLARAASFIGLGLSLALIGWLHGRLRGGAAAA